MNNYIFSQPKEYILTVGAEKQPITISEVKSYCKITGNSQDALISTMINAATAYFEKYTKRELIVKTYKCYLDAFPTYNYNNYISTDGFLYIYKDTGIEIKKSKLQSIVDIKYYLNGVLTTWSATDYLITKSPTYSSIYLVKDKSYPTVDERPQAIEITLTTGSYTCVPDDIKIGLMAHINSMLSDRGDCGDSTLPFITKSIYDQHKILKIGVF